MTKKPKKEAKQQTRIFATEQTRRQLREIAEHEQRDMLVVLARIVGEVHAGLFPAAS